jgi:hypothetical protein
MKSPLLVLAMVLPTYACSGTAPTTGTESAAATFTPLQHESCIDRYDPLLGGGSTEIDVQRGVVCRGVGPAPCADARADVAHILSVSTGSEDRFAGDFEEVTFESPDGPAKIRIYTPVVIAPWSSAVSAHHVVFPGGARVADPGADIAVGDAVCVDVP